MPDWLLDATFAIAALISGLVSTASETVGSTHYTPRDGWAYLLIVLGTLPLVLRSRAPMAVLLFTVTAVVTLSVSGYSEGVLPVWVLLMALTVGSKCSLPRVVVSAAVIAVELVILLAFAGHGFGAGDFVVQIALFSTAFAVGSSIQSRRLRIVALEQRSEALEASRAEEARRAVVDERLRIAQELHDVVAHTMGVIAVQAGTGAHVIDSDPVEAKRALENIAATSRSSLAELRRLLGVLRDPDGERVYAPAPGLADLDRLVADVGAAGLPVELVVDGEADGMAQGAELAAYRIVQEALTNALKHAGPARATVRLHFEPGALRIEVADDGRGAAAGGFAAGTGHGLVGMRERVAVYGGSLHAGPQPGGGFRVCALLPFGEAEAS